MNRDQALIEEAVKRIDGVYSPGTLDLMQATARVALELERSGWQPTDPDVLAVREILAAHADAAGNFQAVKEYRDGSRDGMLSFEAALAAYRKHKGAPNG